LGDENLPQDACPHNHDRTQYAIKLSLAKYIKLSEFKVFVLKQYITLNYKTQQIFMSIGPADIMLYWYLSNILIISKQLY